GGTRRPLHWDFIVVAGPAAEAAVADGCSVVHGCDGEQRSIEVGTMPREFDGLIEGAQLADAECVFPGREHGGERFEGCWNPFGVGFRPYLCGDGCRVTFWGGWIGYQLALGAFSFIAGELRDLRAS